MDEHLKSDDQQGKPSQSEPSDPESGQPTVTPDQWYYAVDGRSFGPVSEKDLRALARQGNFSREDYVYSACFGDWVQARSVYGLFDGLSDDAPEVEYVAPPPQVVLKRRPRVLKYAGIWVRLAAFFVDAFLVIIPGCLISWTLQVLALFAVSAPSPVSVGSSAQPQGEPLIAILALFALPPVVFVVGTWLYCALMESSRWQATLGKTALGLLVADVDGHRITFGRATVRYFASILSGFTLGIGFVMAAFTSRRQGLHDLLTGTIVVYSR